VLTLKTLKLLVAILCLLFAIDACADTIPLSSGSGTMQSPFIGFPIVVWTFQGQGGSITQLLTGDAGTPGLIQCCPTPDVTPLTLSTLWTDVGAFEGQGLVNGVSTFFDLFMQINPISATGHMQANGDLVVTYLATGEIVLTAVDLSDSPLGQQYAMNKNWRVTAIFTPGGSGTWDFQTATFATVPEPGSMVMLGTGLCLLVRKLRRHGTRCS
jgi:PEP-CTERM motif